MASISDPTFGYDLSAAISLDFLNRMLVFGMQSKVLPSIFDSNAGFGLDEVGLYADARMTLKIERVHLFCKPEQSKILAAAIDFSGTCVLAAKLSTLPMANMPALRAEPELSRDFTISFNGRLQADAQLALAGAPHGQTLQLSFAGLTVFELLQIGALEPGPDFSELLRRLIERMGLIELSTRFKLPDMNGFASSGSIPLHQILSTPAGQIGMLDFKTTPGQSNSSADQIHVLLQNTLNLGQQRFADVVSLAPREADLTLVLGYRLLRQLLQDTWSSGIIPRKFNDKGMIDAAGKNQLTRLDLVTYASSIGVKTSVQRSFAGTQLHADVDARFSLSLTGQFLQVRLEEISLGLELDWLKAVGMSAIFIVLWEVVLRSLAAALNLALDQLTPARLQPMLGTLRIPVKWSGNWGNTPFGYECSLVSIDISPTGIVLAAQTGLHL